MTTNASELSFSKHELKSSIIEPEKSLTPFQMHNCIKKTVKTVIFGKILNDTETSTTRLQEAACIPILLLGRGISLFAIHF